MIMAFGFSFLWHLIWSVFCARWFDWLVISVQKAFNFWMCREMFCVAIVNESKKRVPKIIVEQLLNIWTFRQQHAYETMYCKMLNFLTSASASASAFKDVDKLNCLHNSLEFPMSASSYFNLIMVVH